MNKTINLEIENLASAQAQKHVTVNEAFARIDAATQLAVLDRDLTDPPAAPSDGARYLLPTGATGAWSGHDGKIAAWEEATLGWLFLTPHPGWRLWVLDEELLVVLTGTGWQATGGGATSVNPVAGGLIGINTTADAVNRIAVKTDAALFSHDDVTPGSGDMRFTLNKASSTDDTSLTLQSGYSTRAQVGLTGDDDLHVKVSPDGGTFHEAIVVDSASGSVDFPNGSSLLSFEEVTLAGGDQTLGVTDAAGIVGFTLITSGQSLSAASGRMAGTWLVGSDRTTKRCFIQTLEDPFIKFLICSVTIDDTANTVSITNKTARFWRIDVALPQNQMSNHGTQYELGTLVLIRSAG